ncbi:MAG: class IV adenylate cyclase [Elusimicrobia bacterium]|nr:class IV adenylate cyclase [Elusimicrobiota bacterium]
MPSNIEIKARASNWDKQIKIARKLSDRKEKLIQVDTFFKYSEGRLKLREQKGKEDYLIFYKRSDKKGPKYSKYFTYQTKDAKVLKSVLSKAMGTTKVIRKKRMVFFVAQTRIHFDEVEGLGKFIEIEVCLKKNQLRLSGLDIAERIIKALNIDKKDFVKNAYADLI